MSLYVYAILDAAPDPPRLPRVRYVPLGRLAAAVRPARHTPEPRRPALQRHAAVVEALWRAAPAVLPVRFGSLVADERELRRELRPRAAELRRALDLVRGRAQMTLRVLDVPSARPPAAADRAPSGREYLAARAAWARGDDVPGLRALLAALRPLRTAERIERHPALAAASVYHLVDSGRVPHYRRALARRRGRLRVSVSGPWPPYAFVPEVGA